MEEYRDLHLTVDAFTTVLDEAPYHHLRAGIVLQAYLPDTHDVLDRLLTWAPARHGAAGRRSRCASSRAPTWRWRTSTPSSAAGRRRRTPPRPRSTPATRRCSTACSTAPRPAACRSAWPATTCSTSPGRWARSAAATSPGAVEIEMLEGMAPPQSRADARRGRRAAAVHARRHRRGLRRRASPTCRAASTRTPGRRTSCARCSRSRPARRRGTPSGRGSRPRSRTARPSTARPAGDQDRSDASVRAFDPERAVRQRAGHRLHAGRQPGVDRRPPGQGPPGRDRRRC